MTTSKCCPSRAVKSVRGLLVLTLLVVPGCGPSKNDLLLRSAQRIRDDVDKDENKPAPETSPPSTADVAETELTDQGEAKQAESSPTPASAVDAPSPLADSVAETSTAEPESKPEGSSRPAELRTADPIDQLGLVPIDERMPEEPLPESERRKLAAEHLHKIAEALIAYARDKKRLPPTYFSANGFQTLSWRVELLPYLGYQELYEKFDKTVPWNRAPNDELLKYIPDVYASPERFDVKTNILMPARGGFIGGDGGGLPLDEQVIEDGVANTLLLIEVNDDQAVPWTAPEDFAPENFDDVSHRLFKLRKDGAFAVWANGWTMLLAAGTSPKMIWDAMSIEAGDGLMAGRIHRDIPLENVSEAAVAAAENEIPTVESEIMPAAPSGPEATLAVREPVPTGGQVAEVQDRFRQVFSERLSEAKGDQDKLKLAGEILDKAAEMGEDPVGAYTLQNAAMRLAIDAGGIRELLRAVDQRVARFEVDPFQENMTWMLEFGRGVAQRDVKTIDGQEYVKRAVSVIFAAIHDDQYVDASSLARYSFRLIDQDRDEAIPEQLTRLRGLLGQAKRDFDEASKSLAAYRQNPNDGQAAADVGRYLCFIKGDWQRGLPLLTEGGPQVLQDMATLDLKGASDSTNKVAIADAWWDLSEKARSSVYRQSARDRAALWYRQAYEVMPDSLDRLHVKARLDEAEEALSSSPLAVITELAEEVGVDLTISLAATAEAGGARHSSKRSMSRDDD